MDALKSLVQPLVGGAAGSSVIDGMKLVVLGGTVETARRVSSSACMPSTRYWPVTSSVPVARCIIYLSDLTSFFLTAHFSEEDYPYDWLMLWLSRQPEWQRSREFETTTRSSSGFARTADNSFGDDEDDDEEDDEPGKVKTRVVFQPTFDTTHTIFYRGHWLRIKRGRKNDGSGCEVLSISVVARNNSILKQLVLQAKREYEAEAVHRIQIYFADSHGSWRWTDSRHKRPMGSIVLNPGVKEMLLGDTRDFLKSEQWYADRGIPFRRGYLLHGVPGSGKSSLIHAIAGELMLDIYVVSLSSSWISDSTLTTLMGRVPSRCILLLEDLDAAFTRSVSRDKNSSGNPDGNNNEGDNDQSNTTTPAGPSTGRRRHQRDQLSDVNTLSLSGLLNALDGVAAAEGRLLFATTNHLERLDPALSRPGRMDVWIEFKNASKWQAEALFRNFFPSVEEPAAACNGVPPPGPTLSDMDEAELEGIDIPSPPQTPSSGSSTLWSLSPSFASSTSSLPPSPKNNGAATSKGSKALPQFGANNQAYLPPPVEEHIASSQHSAKPLDAAKLALLAKRFADAIPEEEFSVAALQGYLLKHKSNPDKAADEAAEWVVSEREMKVRLKVEKEKREKEEKERKDKKKKEKEDEKKKQQDLEKDELEKLKKELKEREEKDKEREQAAAAAAAETEPAPSPEVQEVVVVAVPTPPPEPESPAPEPATVVAVEDTNTDSDSDSDEENVPPEPAVQPDEWESTWTPPGKWAKH
ncbi:P-loop containing nucleoside triphosphate hydrolase protein [Armillaria gallica]|uniref:P-loop containing nucleoside triphosphate hydrolase protein n=1 Tax=Armillaria gallica TaxID=47427 RepID=A0A2H3D4D2_ARMGA|nr:P-loop containing nucleoside triphosphate hydrolase protein [Armillaria gallica]